MPVLAAPWLASSRDSAATSLGKIAQSAGRDDEVVIAALKADAAHLDDAEPAPLGAVLRRELLERDDAVRQALQLEVARLRRPIVEQQHGAVASDEELLQAEDLPPIPQRLARQQPHLGQRVEDDTRRG